MNAVCLYVTAAKVVLQANAATAQTSADSRLEELNTLLPQLRQQFACVVCARLLCDPFVPRDARCQHNVCRLCVRGRKSLRPACSHCAGCQDYKTYHENRHMRCLLLCYKSLCEHVRASPLYSQLSSHQHPAQFLLYGTTPPVLPLATLSPQEIVSEGASYDDVLSSFTTDLQRNMVAKLPSTYVTATQTALPAFALTAAAAPTAPFSMPLPQLTPATQYAPKAATPPLIKQELFSSSSSPPLSAPSIPPPPSTPAALPPMNTLALLKQQPQQTLTVKHLKNIVDLSAATAASSGTGGRLNTAAGLFVGASLPAGVVVPIVSSSGTTSAPLSIASAKLQTLNRQLVQARNAAKGMAGGSVSTSGAVSSDSLQSPLAFKVSLAYAMAPAAMPSTTTTTTTTNALVSASTTTPTMSTTLTRQPPAIKTVSNGSAMYSVLYTGIGNKITIKRKTDSEDDLTQRKNAATANAYRPLPAAQKTAASTKRRGCRCGNATPTPGKLTCCGQRCPCYVDSKSCIGCKCRGCRNPHRPDGGKVRPVIPELACYEIEMAADDTTQPSLSPCELPPLKSTTATAAATTTAPDAATAAARSVASAPFEQPQPQTQQQQSSSVVVATSSASTATLIPFRGLQPPPATLNDAHIHHHQHQHQQQQQQQQQQHLQQQQQQHQQQQLQSSMLQLENLQRESVLIQNAEGKYQVVNLFTTHSSSHQQRIHTVSSVHSSAMSAITALPAVSSAFILPQMAGGLLSAAATAATVTTATTSVAPPTLPQLIIQQQHQQSQLQRLASNSASISLQQLQQQLKQHTSNSNNNNNSNGSNNTSSNAVAVSSSNNNIITVHPISAPTSALASTMSLATTAGGSGVAPPPTNTITLSPLIVGTQPATNRYATDVYADGAPTDEAGAAPTTSTAATAVTQQLPHIVALPADLPATSPSSHFNGGGGVGSGVASVSSAGAGAGVGALPPPTAMVVESNEM